MGNFILLFFYENIDDCKYSGSLFISIYGQENTFWGFQKYFV